MKFAAERTWRPCGRFLAALAFLLVSLRPMLADSVVIGVIGDFGGAVQGPTFASNELAVANLVKRWNPDFVMTTGDNNYREGAASTIDPNIGQFYHEYIHPYLGSYGAGASSNRFFPCLGNHDWTTASGQPYLNYFTLPGNERYYAYRFGPVEIFALNSNADSDGTTSSSIQGRWLQAQLAASTASWRLVFFHHPPYSAGAGGAAMTSMRWPFAAWGAHAVLLGHDHLYARLRTNGMVYFINGLGGESIGGIGGTPAPGVDVRYNGDFGAMRIEATESNVVFHFVTRNNVVVDSHVLGESLWSPFILASPLNQTAPAGRTVRFDVQAVGAGPLRFQWQLNSANLPNRTNSSLVITNVQSAHEGDYSVLVTGGGLTSRSKVATLALLRHPLITLQPQNVMTKAGSNVTFRVIAEGAGPLRYQWLFNSNAIAGATGTNLAVTNVSLAHDGIYAVRVTDDAGSILSHSVRLTVLVRPTVTQSPISRSVAPGETVVLSVAASGTLPMSYGWRRDGRFLTNIILNARTCFFVLTNVQLTNTGSYQVGITNAAGIAVDGLTPNAALTLLEDRDGDGLPDAWEAVHSLQPDDPTDSMLDADGDHASNLDEYRAGTDPNSSASLLRIARIVRTADGQTAVRFPAVSNRTYAVEAREGLQGSAWFRVNALAAAPTNHVYEWVDSLNPGQSTGRFYRVVTPFAR